MAMQAESIRSLFSEVAELSAGFRILQGHVNDIREQLQAIEARVSVGGSKAAVRGLQGLAREEEWQLQLREQIDKDFQQVFERMLAVEKDGKKEVALMSLRLQASTDELREQLTEAKSSSELRHKVLRELLEKARAAQDTQRSTTARQLQDLERDLRRDLLRLTDDCEAQRKDVRDQLVKHLEDVTGAVQLAAKQENHLENRVDTLDAVWRQEAERLSAKHRADILATQEMIDGLRSSFLDAHALIVRQAHQAFAAVQALPREGETGHGSAGLQQLHDYENLLQQEVVSFSANHAASQNALREVVSMNEALTEQELRRLSERQQSLDSDNVMLSESMRKLREEVSAEVARVVVAFNSGQSSMQTHVAESRTQMQQTLEDERGVVSAALRHLLDDLRAEIASTAATQQERATAVSNLAQSSAAELKGELTARFDAFESRLREVETEVNMHEVINDVVREQDRGQTESVCSSIIESLRTDLLAVAKEQEALRFRLERQLSGHEIALKRDMQRLEALLHEAGFPAEGHMAALEAEMRLELAKVSEEAEASTLRLQSLIDSEQLKLGTQVSPPPLERLPQRSSVSSCSGKPDVQLQLTHLEASQGALQESFDGVKHYFEEKLSALDSEVRSAIERVLDVRENDHILLQEELARQRSEFETQQSSMAEVCRRIQGWLQTLRTEVEEVQSYLLNKSVAKGLDTEISSSIVEKGSVLAQQMGGLYERLQILEQDLSSATCQLETSARGHAAAAAAVASREAESMAQESSRLLQQQYSDLQKEIRGEMAGTVLAVSTQTAEEEAADLHTGPQRALLGESFDL